MNTHRPDWRGQAACAETDDPEMWFSDTQGRRSRLNRERTEQAQAICAGCPVQERCLDVALALPPGFDLYGIYGGLTVEDRRDLRRNDSTAAYASNWNEHAWLIGGDRSQRVKRKGRREVVEQDPDREAEERADRRFA